MPRWNLSELGIRSSNWEEKKITRRGAGREGKVRWDRGIGDGRAGLTGWEGRAASIQPSPKDPWRWQHFIRGTEYSARFVDAERRITLRECDRSEGALRLCEGIPVPDNAESALSGLESKYRLTRQYAFDYFREGSSGRFFVIQCNSRVFSGPEGVSSTPGWCD